MKKQTILQFIKKNALFIGLSFLIPVVVMALAYYQAGIYPGSEYSVLASDAFAQYANFHASVNNVLHGKQSIFYTWSGSLGLNYWSLMAYYLNGIFTPLVGLVNNIHMADTLYYLTLLKIGVAGVAFWTFAHNTYRLNRWVVTGFSVAYALMSFSIGYSEVIMWLDTFVYLPLIFLGIHRLMDQKKPGLLFISYLLLFLSNFYMAFMVGLFSFLYTMVRTLLDWSRYKSRIGSYLLTSFLAGGASMVTILPTILDLSNNGESLTPITQFFTSDVGPWDLIAKNMVGVYDTSQYESMPFIYIGLLPLILCVFYFLTKKISWKQKVGYGSLFVLLVASIYIYPLNLFWHGLHSPYMFLFRFSFLFSFLVILLAGYGAEKLTKETVNTFVNAILGIGGVFLVFLLVSNKRRYGIISTETVISTFVLLGLYLVIGLAWTQRTQWVKWLSLGLLVAMTGEAYLNTKAMVNGIREDWGYPSEIFYTQYHEDIQTLTDQTEEANTSFFRMENLDPVSMNDSFNFGYNGVSMFSSIRNRHSSQYVNALGFRSLGTNLQVQYANNTLLADALVGIKYNLAKEDPLKFGYTKVGTSGEYSLYENAYTLPLGILTDEGIYEEGAVANQTEIFQYLADSEESLFFLREATLIDSEHAIVTEDEEANTITIAEEEPGVDKSVTWLITVPANTQGYISLVPADLNTVGGTDIYFTVDGITRKTGAGESGQYYSIGYHEEATRLK